MMTVSQYEMNAESTQYEQSWNNFVLDAQQGVLTLTDI
jgi:hypothetical protein